MTLMVAFEGALVTAVDVAGDVIRMGVSALFGWGIPKLYGRWRRSNQLRLAGAVFPTVPRGSAKPVIHIRASLDEVQFGRNPPTLRGYTHSGEMQAVMDIVEYFESLPVKIEFDYFPEIKHGMKNVVILGASDRSDISRDLSVELSERGIKVVGEGVHAHYRDNSGREYHCAHIQANGTTIVSKDAGIIFRKVTDNGAVILLCGGLHQFGTQAAAEVALSRDFQRKVRKKKFKQFVQFVTADVVTTGGRAGLGLVHHSIRWKTLPLQDIKPINDE